MEKLTDNPGDFDKAPEEVFDLNAKDAVPLCLRCLRPCDPINYYCPNCDSNDAVNPNAAYMPFEQIRYNYGFFGKIWHKIWYDGQTPELQKILYLIFLMIFVPFILFIGVPYLLISKKERTKLSEDKNFLLLFAILLIVLYVLFFGVLLEFIPPHRIEPVSL